MVDEHFRTEDRSNLTPVSQLTSEARSAAQLLLNHYVKVQGSVISQVGISGFNLEVFFLVYRRVKRRVMMLIMMMRRVDFIYSYS